MSIRSVDAKKVQKSDSGSSKAAPAAEIGQARARLGGGVTEEPAPAPAKVVTKKPTVNTVKKSETSVLGPKQTPTADADVDADADAKQGKDKPTDSQLSNQDKKWADKTQDEVNAKVNDLVANGGDDPESYDKIAKELEGLPEDQMVAALAQLPEDSDSEMVTRAVNEQRIEAAEGVSEEAEKAAMEQALELENKVGDVRDARKEILEAAGGAESFEGDKAAAAMREQIEANPELADLIALSTGDVTDRIATQISMDPEGADQTVRDLAAAAEKLSPEVMQQVVTDSLKTSVGENVSPLLAGLAQGSLEGQTALLDSLENSYGEGDIKALLGQARLNVDELNASMDVPANPDYPYGQATGKLDGLSAYASELDPNVTRGMLNYLDQGEPSTLSGLAEALGQTDSNTENGYQQGALPGSAGQNFTKFAELLENGNPEMVARLGHELADSALSQDYPPYQEYTDAMAGSVGEGNVSLGMAFMGQVASKGEDQSAFTNMLRESVDAGFTKLAETYGEAAEVTDRLNADLASIQQWGAFGESPEKVEQAAADFRHGYAEEYKKTDQLAEASLDGLQQLKEFDSKYPDYKANDPETDGYMDLLVEFNSLASTPAGMQQVNESLTRKGAGGPSFLDDLNAAAEASGDPDNFKKQADYLVTHSMQAGQSLILATGSEKAQQSLDGWAAVTKDLGVSGMSDAEIDGLVEDIGNFGDEAIKAFLTGTSTGINAAADALMTVPPGSSPTAQRIAKGSAIGIGLGLAAWDLADGINWGDGGEVWGFLSGAIPGTTDAASLIAEMRGASGLARGLGSVSPFFSGVSSLVGLAGLADELSQGDVDPAAVGFQAAIFASNAASTVGAVAGLWSGVSWAGPLAWGGAIIAFAASAGFDQYKKVKESNRFEVGNGKLSEQAYKYLDTILPADFPRELIPSLLNSTDNGVMMGQVLQDAAHAADITPAQLLEELAKLSPEQASELIESAHQHYGNDPSTAAEKTLGSWEYILGYNPFPGPVGVGGGGGRPMMIV